MSTLSTEISEESLSPQQPTGGNVGAAVGGGAGGTVDPAVDTFAVDLPAGDPDVEALAVEVGAFVAAFERWSSHRAAEAGASQSRMKLLHAVRCHGPRKMADLAVELGTTPRNVTAIVDGLESEGLVRRTPHTTDRRVTLVELTCNRDKIAEQFQRYQRSIGELFTGMDPDDRETLRRLLAGLRERMRPRTHEVGGPAS